MGKLIPGPTKLFVSPITSILIFVLLGIFAHPHSAHASDAEPIEIIDIEQEDINGDGLPDLTIIEFSMVSQYIEGVYPQFAFIDQAIIYVYDQGGNMRSSQDWAEATDFKDDVWIFDVGQDDRVELIIRFGSEGSSSVAYIYDDRDGDGNVSYRVSGTDVIIEESMYWTVMVVSDESGWWGDDGSINHNLRFFIDGTLSRVSNTARDYPDQFLNDGNVNIELESVDSNEDSIPEYQVNRLLSFVPNYYPAQRAGMYVNSGKNKPGEYMDHIFWPLLVTDHWRESYNYFDYVPAVFMDWSTSRIDRVGVQGYPIEEGYHINNFESWEKGVINKANFENPMAYYDLASDNDGYPELFIRFEYVAGNHPAYLFKPMRNEVLQVNYSWDQDNNQTWDYKLSLAGEYSIDSVIPFKDFSVMTVAHAIAPWWVTEKQWGAAIFLSGESGGYRTSEGIYGWAVNAGYDDGAEVPSPLRDSYITGSVPTPPTDLYQGIWEGMRGEYSFDFRELPYLYFSNVDHKLHLLGAEEGIWNIDQEHHIEYKNLNSDEYIDHWTYYEKEEPTKSLIAIEELIVYTDTNKILVFDTNAAKVGFQTLPPRDNIEWLELQSKLEIGENNLIAADGFETMASQFSDPLMSVQGGKISDLRITDQGLRFVLELTPEFHLNSTPDVVEGLSEPGSYLVSFNGKLSIRALTAPHLFFTQEDVLVEPAEIAELNPVHLRVRIHNDGLQDAYDVPVYFSFSNSIGHRESMTTTVPLIPGDGSQVATLAWAPPLPGQWLMEIEIGPGNHTYFVVNPTTEDPINILVLSLPEPSLKQLLTRQGLPIPGMLLILALFMATIVAAICVFLLILEADSLLGRYR